jgi:hypothetical protein
VIFKVNALAGLNRRGVGRGGIGPADRSNPGQHLVEMLEGADHPRPPGDGLVVMLGSGHVQSPFLCRGGQCGPVRLQVCD